MTFTHSQVSFISLVREMILTNYCLTVTALSCTSVFFSQRIIDTSNSLPAKPNDFGSLARFTRFMRSADLQSFYRSDTNPSCS